jgi:hypothetical protein
MPEDSKWLFIDFVPLLCDKKRVAKQLQIETWLDLAQVMKELNISPGSESSQQNRPAIDYIA